MNSSNNFTFLNGKKASEGKVNAPGNAISLVSLLDVDGIRLKRVARTNGGEWAGACPFCGGRDRFRVWPNEGRGRYWCRGCGKAGDSIDYLRESRGLSFLEACVEIGIDPAEIQSQRPIQEEKPNPSPSLIWQGQAESFLKETVKALWNNSKALSFLHGRGLQDETIRAACLGWNKQDQYEDREAWGLEPLRGEKERLKKLWLPSGLVIPLRVAVAVLRLRIRRPQGEPHYVIVSGSDTRPMTWNLNRGAVVIVESELDGLLIAQEVEDMTGIMALGSAQAKPNHELNGLLTRASSILVSLDFDEAGARASWQYWLSAYPNAKRWPVPVGKDPSEALQKGLSIRAWIEAGLTVQSSSFKDEENTRADVKPFPKQWLSRFDEEQLERLAIMTVDGRLTDREAFRRTGWN